MRILRQELIDAGRNLEKLLALHNVRLLQDALPKRASEIELQDKSCSGFFLSQLFEVPATNMDASSDCLARGRLKIIIAIVCENHHGDVTFGILNR